MCLYNGVGIWYILNENYICKYILVTLAAKLCKCQLKSSFMPLRMSVCILEFLTLYLRVIYSYHIMHVQLLSLCADTLLKWVDIAEYGFKAKISGNLVSVNFIIFLITILKVLSIVMRCSAHYTTLDSEVGFIIRMFCQFLEVSLAKVSYCAMLNNLKAPFFQRLYCIRALDKNVKFGRRVVFITGYICCEIHIKNSPNLARLQNINF